MGGTWGHWAQLNTTRGCRNSMNAPLAGGKRSKLVGWVHRPMTMGLQRVLFEVRSTFQVVFD